MAGVKRLTLFDSTALLLWYDCECDWKLKSENTLLGYQTIWGACPTSFKVLWTAFYVVGLIHKFCFLSNNYCTDMLEGM